MATDIPVEAQRAALAARLVAETGISTSQARELILFLGANWSSLVREAKLLACVRT